MSTLNLKPRRNRNVSSKIADGTNGEAPSAAQQDLLAKHVSVAGDDEWEADERPNALQYHRYWKRVAFLLRTGSPHLPPLRLRGGAPATSANGKPSSASMMGSSVVRLSLTARLHCGSVFRCIAWWNGLFLLWLFVGADRFRMYQTVLPVYGAGVGFGTLPTRQIRDAIRTAGFSERLGRSRENCINQATKAPTWHCEHQKNPVANWFHESGIKEKYSLAVERREVYTGLHAYIQDAPPLRSGIQKYTSNWLQILLQAYDPEGTSGAKKHSEGKNSNPEFREPKLWNVQLPEA
ncbi:hypothetical protein K438DRAFT_1765494 [Mycena galopus ATCC 62051]|nr:hypothetical protein K438DRAFT_1765494 [Mycena galopus ATCC 62051]